VNLRDAAELCVDLARVIDGRDVPALLQRAANVLDAKGVILWMTDSGGALLRPQLAHGYADRVLVKMGTLQVDADNATSLAFRSLRGQTVNGAAPSSAGAIAVPLLTSSGCVGVLAAEINRQRPSAETVDMARIIAAQLATFVIPSGEVTRVAQG
jgi:GAF domain-containing protein